MNSAWHKVFEAMAGGHVFVRNPNTGGVISILELKTPFEWNKFAYDIREAAKFQRYVFSDEVMKIIHPESHLNTLRDMLACNIHDLPFPTLSMEYDYEVEAIINGKSSIRVERGFVILVKVKHPEFSHAALWFGLTKAYTDHNMDCLLVCPVSILINFELIDDEPALRIEQKIVSWFKNEEHFVKAIGAEWKQFMPQNKMPWHEDVADISRLMAQGMILLNTKGIVKEEVAAPVKLNASRAKTGKPSIPSFTYVRIGKVYNREGHEAQVTGRKMPIHLRSGYVRNQHHGVGRQLVKKVYIQPCLVNYEPGIEVPNKPRLVTA